MIGYIEGKILKYGEGRVLVLANQVGYEILMPAIVLQSLKDISIGDDVSLFIYYHQTERQPRPILIGFNSDLQREFFQQFISVGDIGPLKAAKALDVPVEEIAHAIESKDIGKLSQLKGIGNRTAQKIIATLHGKVGRFAADSPIAPKDNAMDQNFVHSVLDVLITQMGHKTVDAKKMIKEALERNGAISTPEELFEEIYRKTG